MVVTLRPSETQTSRHRPTSTAANQMQEEKLAHMSSSCSINSPSLQLLNIRVFFITPPLLTD